MATNTLFSTTLQAADDTFFWTEDDLLASSLLSSADTTYQNVLTLNVMSNDLGGKSKSLFSIDDGNGHTSWADYDLLNEDSNGVWESTGSGDRIRIYNGQIQLDLSASLTALGATDVNSLAAGDHIHEEFVYAIRLGNGTLSQAKVAVDIYGQNDAAAIGVSPHEDTSVTEAGGAGNGIPGDPHASGQLTVTDADHGENRFQPVAAAALTGSYGKFTFDSSTGAWTYTLDQAKADPLIAGEPATDALTVTSLDGTASQTITVDITGANDAPVIGGADSAVLKEDNRPLWTSGQLTAVDPDLGATQTWSIAGGSPALQDYNFALDEFKITRNGVTYFDDTFSDGVAPPNAPNLIGGGAIGYGVGPGGASFFETAGRVLLVGAPNAAASAIAINGFAFAGQRATLQTDNSDALNGSGLKKNMTFTVDGRFDLAIPADIRDQYGIRLSDNTFANTGDNSVGLAVRRDADGVHVTLSELNVATASSTVLQQINLNPLPGDDQIVLHLSHATTDSTVITASFDLVDDGVVTSTMNFSATGHAFDNENWVQAQFLANGPPEADSVLVGTYSTLTVDQDGQWTARIRNGSPAVQALAEDQTVTDTFNVQVTDDMGAVGTKPVVVTVIGSNDAPSITDMVLNEPVFGETSAEATGMLYFQDVDLGDIHHVEVVPQATSGYAGLFSAIIGTDSTNLGSGTVGLTFAVNFADVEALGPGEHPQTYTISVYDNHGGVDSTEITIPLNNQDENTNHSPIIGIDIPGGDTPQGHVSGNQALGFLLHATGTLSFSDEDTQDNHIAFTTQQPDAWGVLFASVTQDTTGSGTGGVLDWHYQVNLQPLVQALGEGQSHFDKFFVAVDDNLGGIDQQEVIVEIAGFNDRPTVDGPPMTEFTFDANSGGLLTIAGGFGYHDFDTFDFHSVHVEFQPGGGGPDPIGTFHAELEAASFNSGSGGLVHWSYLVDPDDWSAAFGNDYETFNIVVADQWDASASSVVRVHYDDMLV